VNRSRGPRRLLRAAGGLLGVGVLAFTAFGAVLLWPRDDEPGRADAVVMLAGADDGRHAHARELVEAGVAPVLLVSNPDGLGEPLARSLCTGDERPGRTGDAPATGVEVVCFDPEPRTTLGEARAVDAIARRRGWHSVVVVTNRPHTLRARTWFRDATGLEVRMSPIRDVDWPMLPRHLAWEAGGYLKGLLGGRG